MPGLSGGVTRWVGWLALSGATGLAYEVVWLRRMGLVLGGSSVAGALTVGAFMAGLGVGAAAVSRYASRGPLRAVRIYGLLEAAAALWALGFPLGMGLLTATTTHWPALRWVVAVALLMPPATALGATWPLLGAHLSTRRANLLYAANTTGAVLGVLLTTFVALPALGVRGTEVAAALVGLFIAVGAQASPLPPATERVDDTPTRAPRVLLAVAAATGLASLGLQMVWFRLAAVAFGATVQTMGGVLAVFLATIALGSAVGRRWPSDPALTAAVGLVGLGALALLGALTWPFLPYGLGVAYGALGPERLWFGNAVLAAAWMAGAPAASGLAFAGLTRLASRHTTGDSAAMTPSASLSSRALRTRLM